MLRLRRQKAYFYLALLFPTSSISVNYAQCFADVKNCAADLTGQNCPLNISNITALSVLRTSKGTPITNESDLNSTDIATAISFTGCKNYCGTGQEPFSWNVFSQEFASWLLPYLALISQLPFGARRRTDNLMSAILTLGSPTLAGYSLYISLLNARWLNDKLFSQIDYPSATVRKTVVQTLNRLQQVPLRFHPESGRLQSLVILHQNDKWWRTLSKELDYSHTWSIASATSIAWVVIAYLLTVADSFSTVANHINSNGQGTGSVWLWLLPIVVGWLILSPKCDYNRVHDAYEKANQEVFAARSGHPNTETITTDFGLTICPNPYWDVHKRNITSLDEARIPPVFGYARVLPWSQTVYIVSLYYRTAWKKWNTSRSKIGGGRYTGQVTSDGVPEECRHGRLEQIKQYCDPDGSDAEVLWHRGVLYNMVVASLMSLQLQWATTSAAVLVVWYTPTIGLGCRSLAFLIYGAISTTVWMLLVTSSVLGYYAHCNYLLKPLKPNEEGVRVEGQTYLYRIISSIADWMRWTGKSLAIINAIGIVANSVFQYAGVYDNCYCDSSVMGWGAYAYYRAQCK